MNDEKAPRKALDEGASLLRRGRKTRVLVIGPYLTDRAAPEASIRSREARLDEAVGLACAIDVEIVGQEIVPLAQIRPATYLG